MRESIISKKAFADLVSVFFSSKRIPKRNKIYNISPNLTILSPNSHLSVMLIC